MERKLLFSLFNNPQPAAAEQLAFLLRIWKGTTVPTEVFLGISYTFKENTGIKPQNWSQSLSCTFAIHYSLILFLVTVRSTLVYEYRL
jgi:hypothetical protein